METTINLGQTWQTAAEAKNAIRDHARHILGSVFLMLGLLTATSPRESLTNAFLSLALVIVASALFNASEGKGGAL